MSKSGLVLLEICEKIRWCGCKWFLFYPSMLSLDWLSIANGTPLMKHNGLKAVGKTKCTAQCESF